jgi:hypothetical protein
MDFVTTRTMKKDRKRKKKKKKEVIGLSLCTKSIRITVVAWRHGKLGSRLTSFRPFRNSATNEIDKDFSLPLSLWDKFFGSVLFAHNTKAHRTRNSPSRRKKKGRITISAVVVV